MTSRTLGGIASAARRLARGAPRREQPHDLADEERVALGLLVDRRDELASTAISRRVSSMYSRDVGSLRPAERDPARHRLARELGERRGERVARAVGSTSR